MKKNGEIIIYRLGGLSIDQIEAVVGKVSVQLNQSSNPKAPGQLKSHYAPKKPVYIGDLKNLLTAHSKKKNWSLWYLASKNFSVQMFY